MHRQITKVVPFVKMENQNLLKKFIYWFYF